MKPEPIDLTPTLQVEVFLKVRGRLPNKPGDTLTIEDYQKFIKLNPDNINIFLFCKKEIQLLKESE